MLTQLGRVVALNFPLRAGIFVGIFAAGLLPMAALLWLLLTPPLRELLLAVTLYVWLLVLLWQWGRLVRSQAQPFFNYGLAKTPSFYRELGLGLIIGVCGLFLLFGVEGGLGWLQWQPIQPVLFLQTLGSGLLVGLGVALVEELLFRGWLLNELMQDYGLVKGSLISALTFAVAHFLRPLPLILQTWPQFPGLILMGWVLIQARLVRDQRLGLSIGLHAGWVWSITLVNTLGWVRYTGAVPEWLTGIGGNPVAGLMGMVFLGLTGAGLLVIPANRQENPS